MNKILFSHDNGTLSLHGTVRLGSLIAMLEPYELRPASLSPAREARDVYFDFGDLAPEGLHSYRGYYDHLALAFGAPRGKPVDVTVLLAMLRNANGHEFRGYKGGEYTMNLSTPVWVSERSVASATAIVGLIVEATRIVILTAYNYEEH